MEMLTEITVLIALRKGNHFISISALSPKKLTLKWKFRFEWWFGLFGLVHAFKEKFERMISLVLKKKSIKHFDNFSQNLIEIMCCRLMRNGMIEN